MFNEGLLLGEEDFVEKMKTEVRPYLEQFRENGFMKSDDGKRIHFAKYIQKEPLGNVVISHGFSEFEEKYEEQVYVFLKQGFNVYFVEHRGHGYSDRSTQDEEIVHVDNFEQYVDDLHKFVHEIVPDRNRYLFAHSMGGAIGIRYLEKYPEDFYKAVLSAPMCDMLLGSYPRWSVKLITGFMCLIGNKAHYSLGQSGFKGPTFEKSSNLSRARYMYYYGKRVDNTHYRTGGGSYGWVRAALKASDKLMKKRQIKKINCPILILQAELDHLVDIKAQDKFLERAKTARMIRVKGAKHEIFNGYPEHRKLFYKEVIAFLEQ